MDDDRSVNPVVAAARQRERTLDEVLAEIDADIVRAPRWNVPLYVLLVVLRARLAWMMSRASRERIIAERVHPDL